MIQPCLIRNILLLQNSSDRNCQCGIAQEIPDTCVAHVRTGFDPRPWLVAYPWCIGHDDRVDAGGYPFVEVFRFVVVFVCVELQNASEEILIIIANCGSMLTWCVSLVVNVSSGFPTSIPSISGSPVSSIFLRQPSPPSENMAFAQRVYA